MRSDPVHLLSAPGPAVDAHSLQALAPRERAGDGETPGFAPMLALWADLGTEASSPGAAAVPETIGASAMAETDIDAVAGPVVALPTLGSVLSQSAPSDFQASTSPVGLARRQPAPHAEATVVSASALEPARQPSLPPSGMAVAGRVDHHRKVPLAQRPEEPEAQASTTPLSSRPATGLPEPRESTRPAGSLSVAPRERDSLVRTEGDPARPAARPTESAPPGLAPASVTSQVPVQASPPLSSPALPIPPIEAPIQPRRQSAPHAEATVVSASALEPARQPSLPPSGMAVAGRVDHHRKVPLAQRPEEPEAQASTTPLSSRPATGLPEPRESTRPAGSLSVAPRERDSLVRTEGDPARPAARPTESAPPGLAPASVTSQVPVQASPPLSSPAMPIPPIEARVEPRDGVEARQALALDATAQEHARKWPAAAARPASPPASLREEGPVQARQSTPSAPLDVPVRATSRPEQLGAPEGVEGIPETATEPAREETAAPQQDPTSKAAPIPLAVAAAAPHEPPLRAGQPAQEALHASPASAQATPAPARRAPDRDAAPAPRTSVEPERSVRTAGSEPSGPDRGAPVSDASSTTTPAPSEAAPPATETLAPPVAAPAHRQATGAADPPHALFHGRLSTPPGSEHFAPALGTQLRLLLENGITAARLELHPQELGPIEVRIELDGRQATLSMAAELPATRQALEAAVPQLAASLSDAGLTLQGGTVSDSGPRREARDPSGQGSGAGGAGQSSGGRDERQENSHRPSRGLRELRGLVDLYV